MATGRFISYLRVSTERQGRSGLGLEAQRASIDVFLNGGNWQLLGEFIEVESGKRDDNRPQLHAALDACQAKGATLLIAKLDRLSRDAHFLLGLQKAGVSFVAVDMPSANEMTVGIMALVAQEERRAISRRTKDALSAAKARGVKLGNPANLSATAAAKGRQVGTETIVAQADDFARRRFARISQLQEEGQSLREIAKALNEEGILTARGKAGGWSAQSVKNVLQRGKR